jgi:hypothetical protein
MMEAYTAPQTYGLGAKIAADPFTIGFPMTYGLGMTPPGHQQRNSGYSVGEVMRWAPLGPGGFPQMSLQGCRTGDCGRRVGAYGDQVTLGELIEWTKLGPGGFPPGSLQGLGQAEAEGAGKVIGPTVEMTGSVRLPPWGILAGLVAAFAVGYTSANVMRFR